MTMHTRKTTSFNARTLLAAAAGLAVCVAATNAQQDRSTTRRSTTTSISSSGNEVTREITQIIDGVEYKLAMVNDEIRSVTIDGLALDNDAFDHTPDEVIVHDGDRVVVFNMDDNLFVGQLDDGVAGIRFFGGEGRNNLPGLARFEPEGQAVWQVANPPKTMVGISQTSLDDQLRQHLDLEPGVGLVVINVVDDLPAAKAGIQEGDVIIEIAGDTVRNSAQLTGALREREAGDVLGMVVLRKGVPQSLELELVAYDRQQLNQFDQFFDREMGDNLRFPGVIRLEERPLNLDAFDELLQNQLRLAERQAAEAGRQAQGLNELLIHRGDRAIVIEREGDRLRDRAEELRDQAEELRRVRDEANERIWKLIDKLQDADTDEARETLRDQLESARNQAMQLHRHAEPLRREAQRLGEAALEGLEPQLENYARWAERQAREVDEGLAARNQQLAARLETLESRLDRVLRALEARVDGEDERE